MPKRLSLRERPPVTVYEATQAFGSELRVALLHYFAQTPGRQADAVLALGVDRAVVTSNVQVLVNVGLLVPSPTPTNRRSHTYVVDEARFDELLAALRDYTRPRHASSKRPSSAGPAAPK